MMMFRAFILKILMIVFFSGMFFTTAVIAQYENKNTADLKVEALKNFESGNYSESLEQYRSLLKRYPKDGMFSYYCGLSLLRMDKDIPSAIKYLEFAASKPTVPYHVSYFLGDAYTRNYQFPQARKAYADFAGVASKAELKDLMPARLAEMSANAVELTKSYNELDVLASSLFSFRDSASISKLHAPGGTLSLKPAALLPGKEGIKDLSNLMFIPRNTEKGDLLFYAGYAKNKKNGTEIFMVKSSNGNKFSEPVLVEALNTGYDEILPYYDPVGKDLIFASKGHNSMGGFDLFKSHYDADRNTWTPPISLGFPVNSPFDDFLMIPGTDMGNIMTITGRQGNDTMVTAYLLRIHEPRKQITADVPAELKKIGNFGEVETSSMTAENIQEIFKNEKAGKAPEVNEPPVKIVSPAAEETKDPDDYNRLLRLALDEQFKADSLARLAREARVKIINIASADERWPVQQKIMAWEKESATCQATADDYYVRVRQLEKGKPQAKELPAAIEKDTAINDITVYKFKTSLAETSKPEPVDTTVEVPEKPVSGEPGDAVMPAKNSEEIMNRFVLLDKSPYSANNPFPEDINLPRGAYYKVQLAVLGKDPDWGTFGGLSPITTETVPEKSLKKYYAGKFNNYESAKTSLETIRRKGFPEAFIVGWFDGQKLSVNKVMELEKK